jgi:ornithine cyclodeaminase/alanine dehydrogenase-like protein (mu-crystallin family)
VSRGRERAASLVAYAESLGLSARLGTPEDVGNADLVCTCTTSATPVLTGDRLAPGAHVNAIGAYRSDLRELDSVAVARSRVVVETREVALAEAGDLLIAAREGAWDPGDVEGDLAELVQGTCGRASPMDITLFKSVGMASEDLAVAGAALAAAACRRS